MKKNKRTTEFIALSNYQPIRSNDSVSRTAPYVLWGAKHEFAKTLLSAMEKSITHKQITMSIADQIFGKGFIKTDANQTILGQANDSGETWDEVLNKCAIDFKIFGRFAIMVNYNARKTKIVNIYHVNFSEVAVEKASSEDTIDNYYISKDWSKQAPSFKSYPNFLNKEKADTMVYVFTPYSPANDYFPKPKYASDVFLNTVELQWEMSKYKVNGFKNKWSAGMLISLIGTPEDDERDEILKAYKNNFTGSENAQGIVIDFAPDKDSIASIKAIPTSQEFYDNFHVESIGEILNAHNIVDPILVGLGSSNGFTNNADQMQTSYELFFKQVIEPSQVILQRVFSQMFKLAGGTENLLIDKILPYDIQASPNQSQPTTSQVNNNTNPTA